MSPTVPTARCTTPTHAHPPFRVAGTGSLQVSCSQTLIGATFWAITGLDGCQLGQGTISAVEQLSGPLASPVVQIVMDPDARARGLKSGAHHLSYVIPYTCPFPVLKLRCCLLVQCFRVRDVST